MRKTWLKKAGKKGKNELKKKVKIQKERKEKEVKKKGEKII